MTKEPGAASLVAEGFSRIADAVGIVLLCWLGWRMFFVFDSALQGRALVVGLVGMLACWTDKSAKKNTPLAMIAFVAIGLLSAAVHRWSAVVSMPDPVWLSLFTPASHLAVMAVFIYGTAHLLRTPPRLSWFVVGVVASICILSTQIAFDRAASGFMYARGGSGSLPSVPHWGGLHGTSLFLTLGLPLTLSVLFANRSLPRILAGVTLGCGLLFVAFINGSRGGLVALGSSLVLMMVCALVVGIERRWRTRALAAAIITILAGLIVALQAHRTTLEGLKDLSGRGLIWEPTLRLIADHWWIGVGPGNFSRAMFETTYPAAFLQRYGNQFYNAHNLLLHTGAEVGLFGAWFLLAFFAWALRSCWRAWALRRVQLVSAGLLFVLIAFVVHSMSENFLDARAEVDRTRLIVWMVLAAVLAVERLSRVRADSKT